MSKKSWVRLLGFCKFESEAEKKAKLDYLFYSHHKDCEELIHLKTGEPLVAVYFHPDALHRIEVKFIMREIQKIVLYASEYEDDK